MLISSCGFTRPPAGIDQGTDHEAGEHACPSREGRARMDPFTVCKCCGGTGKAPGTPLFVPKTGRAGEQGDAALDLFMGSSKANIKSPSKVALIREAIIEYAVR